MPRITVQDGKLVVREGKVGTGHECCCGGGGNDCSNCDCSVVVSIAGVSFPADGQPYAICLTENATWGFFGPGPPFNYAVTHATAEVYCGQPYQDGLLRVKVSVGYSRGADGSFPFVLGELHTPSTGLFESFRNDRIYVFNEYDACGCAIGQSTLEETITRVTPPLDGECQSELHTDEWSEAIITLDCECGNPLP